MLKCRWSTTQGLTCKSLKFACCCCCIVLRMLALLHRYIFCWHWDWRAWGSVDPGEGFLSVVVVKSLLLNRVWLFATPCTLACQTPPSSSIFQSLLKFMSIELVMLSNQLTLCYPLLLWPSIFPIIRVFPNESALCMRRPKYIRVLFHSVTSRTKCVYLFKKVCRQGKYPYKGNCLSALDFMFIIIY